MWGFGNHIVSEVTYKKAEERSQLEEVGCKESDWKDSAQNRVVWRTFVLAAMFQVPSMSVSWWGKLMTTGKPQEG